MASNYTRECFCILLRFLILSEVFRIDLPSVMGYNLRVFERKLLSKILKEIV